MDGSPQAQVVSHAEPAWPAPDRRPVVFLTDTASPLEQRLLVRWIERNRPNGSAPAAWEAIAIPSSRRPRRGRLDPRLEARLTTGDDPLLAPLRVAWDPSDADGVREVRLSDLWTFGDPRDPGRLRQRWVLGRHPERCRIVVGEPAPASELRQRWQRACGSDAAHTTGLAEFVARQATLALERAERRLRGARYKVPRFVHEDIVSRPSFRGGIARLARELGRPEVRVAREAARDLREIAATHSPYVIDLAAHLIRLLLTRGYEALDYDRRQLEEVYALAQRYPVVFLPTHKSNFDHLVLQYALHENRHPPNHTAGGINMNFFPVGPLVRRSGVFFIRRSFRDDAVYKFVLRQYIDYLVEKRFSLEWYIEGGRSRSGKLLPPMFGMLAYVVDAYRRGKSEDVFLLPVSIAYDQIHDVGDYVAEQRGAAKQRESFRWFVRMIRNLQRRSGRIHIRFGEPLSLQSALGPPDPAAEPNADEQNLALQKVAFEVAVRINRATPITPTSLVTMALLGGVDRAMTVGEVANSLRNLLTYVKRRQLPTTGELGLDTEDGVRQALDELAERGVVVCFAEGQDKVYLIGPDQQMAAAYYRNTIIHFFVNGAIVELALLAAAEAGGGKPVAVPGVAEAGSDAVATFWDEAMRLRDLLKFEFFFADKETFRAELSDEIALHDPAWEEAIAAGPDAIQGLVRRIRPLAAHRVLRPFLEAYRVVGDALARTNPATPLVEATFLATCFGLAKQYTLQRRIHSQESVSKALFATALRLARNRDLVDPGAPDLADRRRAFADEIRQALRRIDAINALGAARRAGLIP